MYSNGVVYVEYEFRIGIQECVVWNLFVLNERNALMYTVFCKLIVA